MKTYFMSVVCAFLLAAALCNVSAVFAQVAPPPAASPVPTTLRQLIEQKAKELQSVQQQRDAVQKNLDEISKSSESLKREVRIINTNVNQLNLSIKANTLTVEKLGFEINSLGDDILGYQSSIKNKRESLKQLFVELQEREHETLLSVFLRNKSLSDSVAEVQAITALSSALSGGIAELTKLQTELNTSLDAAQQKKHEQEAERIDLINRQSIVRDQAEEKQQLLDITKNQEQVYQQQLDQIKKVQDDLSQEMDQYESVLRKTVDPNLLPLPRPGALLWPVDEGHMTQGYGRTPFAIRTYSSQWHNGIDVGGPYGTEVRSAEEGTVINLGNQDAYRGCYKAGYGKFVVVKHTDGLTTLYGHLSKYVVTVGQHVNRGDLIAYLGSTGWATGPHLHFSVFATQTLAPARPGMPEGTQTTRSCGPMPVGGDLDPRLYLQTQ